MNGAIEDWRNVLNGGNIIEIAVLEVYIADREEELQDELTKMQNEAREMQTNLINQKDSTLILQELKRVDEDLKKLALKLTAETEETLTDVGTFLDENMLVVVDNLQNQGLTRERIEKFESIEADISFLGERCAICLNEIEVGRKMKRLDCDGQHSFCHGCINNWFADNATCPFCRHKF